MIVNEAMANAAKYAFGGRKRGQFTVTGTIENGIYSLTYQDDGTSDSAAQVDGTGLGMKIMDAAAQQLEGTLDVSNQGEGYTLTLRLPITTQ